MDLNITELIMGGVDMLIALLITSIVMIFFPDNHAMSITSGQGKIMALGVFSLSILFVKGIKYLWQKRKGEYLEIHIDKAIYGLMKDNKPVETASEDVTTQAKTHIKIAGNNQILKFKVDDPYLLKKGKANDPSPGTDKDLLLTVTLTKIFENKKWIRF